MHHADAVAYGLIPHRPSTPTSRRTAIIAYMTITPGTIAPGTVTDPPVTPGPVGTLREASAAPDAAARSPSPSEADHLFAEGIALLDAGDHLAAAEKVWQAAVTAMVTYSDARGWQPQDWHPHRMLLDIVKLRSEELGIPYVDTPRDTNPITDAYSAGNMLETHVDHAGHFLDLDAVRREIKDARPLLDYFRLD